MADTTLTGDILLMGVHAVGWYEMKLEEKSVVLLEKRPKDPLRTSTSLTSKVLELFMGCREFSSFFCMRS